MKNVLIKIRTSLKLFILVSLLTLIIAAVVWFVYKPIYSVTFNGEFLGYCSQKSKLQSMIDEYIEHGNGENTNIAFVQIDNMPTYSVCLLKRGITTNDEEIFKKIAETGTTYYKYYAILEDSEEKAYVSEFSTAEAVVQALKDKDSDNIDNLQIIEKYETNLADFVTSEEAVASLYKEKKKVVTTVAKTTSSKRYSSSGSTSGFSTSSSISGSKVSLGVSLIRPISGTITSRFGAKSSIRSSAHTGLDIGASKGTSIKAAASGTVVFSGYKGAYGNMVVISHSGSVQTYYGHCSALYVSAGDTVSQGETIAAVGSTGNSTGPHLHFEIRVNGVAYNPQNYVY